MAAPVKGLTAYAHVADVQRSVDFYGRLGLVEVNRHEHEGRLVWAFVASDAEYPNEAGARLMLAVAGDPVDPTKQAVLFYVWAVDVRALHDELAGQGIAVGPITHPFYMPAGEFRVEDPDGYVLLVGQLES
ncbi:MAG: VOC family protein [Gaiellaceae bacterium]